MADAPKPKSVGIATYARVRCFFPDRETLEPAVATKSAKETGGKGILTTLASPDDSVRPMTTQFTDVLGSKTGNEDAYEVICIPLIEQVLLGFKALLIAYGQTGSGKTYSLIGAKGPGQLGLLPRTIKTLIESPKVLKVEMKGFEAYSTSLKKIPLFDLFADVNKFEFEPFDDPFPDDRKKNKQAEYKWVQRKSASAQTLWPQKAGRTGFDTMNEGEIRAVDTIEDGFRLVDEAHDASHFAKTGKNPESSRGHTVYILKIKIQNPQGEDYSPLSTEFVCVDLAGSEGGSTLDALPDGPAKTARFLEGGVINYGLTSLKDMFAEVRKKGKLKQSQGNGLRKLLYPFVTTNTMMAICFTLSPSMENVMPTRATMKFAQDACKLKMKPVADTGGKNWQKMYEKQKALLQEKLDLIEELQHTIDEGISAGGGDGNTGDVLGKLYHEQADKVDSMFKQYDLMGYIEDAIIQEVEDDMAKKKDEYYEKLRTLYEENGQNDKVDGIYAKLDESVEKGYGFHALYDFECQAVGLEAATEKIRQSTISLASNDANNELWQRKAQLLREKTAFATSSAAQEMADIEALLDEEEIGGAEPTMAEMASHDEHDFVIFDEEEEGTSDFYMSLDAPTKAAVDKLFEDPANIVHGQMTPEFMAHMQETFGFTKDNCYSLMDHHLEQVAQAHDAQALEEFAADNEGMLDVDQEDLPLLLELQSKVHTLENEARVEKSLKLWSNMRLKIRDRKLKESEMALMRFQQRDTELVEQLLGAISGSGLGGSPETDMKIEQVRRMCENMLENGVGSSGPDPEVSQQLRSAQAQLVVAQEKLAAMDDITAAIDNNDMSKMMTSLNAAQNQLGEQKVENLRLAGRLDEMRDSIKNQAGLIDELKQQIFIILQFPKTITVSGRVGFNDNMNGEYVVGDHLHGGRVFYRNVSNSWVIRWYGEAGLWIFDHRGLYDDDNGSACANDDVQHPMLVTKQWIVFDGDNFAVDPSVAITGDENSKIAFMRSQGAASAKRGPESKKPMKRAVPAKRGVAAAPKPKKAYTKFRSSLDMPDFSKSNNWMSNSLTPAIYNRLRNKATPNGYTLDMAIQTGVDNPSHPYIMTVGATAGDEETYEVFAELFDPIIAGRHNGYPADYKQPTCLDPSMLRHNGFDEKYVMSSRVRTGRSVRGLCMPPYCNRAERRRVEEIIVEAANQLVEFDASLAGHYEGLYDMTEERHEELIDKHLMFDKPVSPLLTSGGMARDWPDARGVFIADSEKFIVWVNEEDHCRIVSMQTDGNMAEVFERFCTACNGMETIMKRSGNEYMHNEHLGFVLACPSNLGTGIRAGVHAKIPLVSKHERFGEILQNLRLQKRGVGGVDTASEGGIFDLSNLDRLGFSEVQLVQFVCDGVDLIVEMEKALERGEDITGMIPEPIQTPW